MANPVQVILLYDDKCLSATIMVRVAKILTTVFLALLSLIKANAQIEWVEGTPSIASVGPLSITLNYGTKRSGRVYIVVFNYDNRRYCLHQP